MKKNYTKSFEDEVHWTIINQLHSATSRFSSASIELKKMFIILIGIAIPTIVKLAGSKLDFSLFIVIYVLSFAFWYLDSYTYFYQEKLRYKMDERFYKLKLINNNEGSIDQVPKDSEFAEKEEFTLPSTRKQSRNFIRAATNSSVRLYHIFIALNTISLILFLFEIIK